MSLSRFCHPVFQVDVDVSLLAAAREMRARRVGCLLVTDRERPIGIVTDRDLVLRAMAEGLDCRTTPVSKCATFDPITVHERDGVATVAARMRSAGIRRVPVVDDRGKVVGIVTADDLLRELGHELGEIALGIENNSDSSDSR